MSGADPLRHATRLVGRDAELGVLREDWRAAQRGEGQLVLLVGDPGIGKTRTATALASEARESGARVAWGRCHEGEGAPVYWPWLQLLGACAGGAADAEIAALLPLLRSREPLEAGDPPARARFELFDRVVGALGACTRAQPLLLVLDDLHWADTGSLRLLEFLGREIGSLPLLALGTLRARDLSRGDETAARLAKAVRLGRSVPLGPLARPALAQLLADRLGRAPEAAVLDEVARISDGNPYFVIELAHLIAAAPGATARTAVPPGARELLRRRLDPLPEASLRLLRAAAVLGRDFELDLLARVEGEPVESLLAALTPALAFDLVREQPGALRRYAFTHALMRESLYEDLAPGARAALHGAAALALEAAGAGDDERLPALAHHCFEAAQASDPAKAIRYGRAAGERALHLLAFEEATRHFERALSAAELGGDADAKLRTLIGLGEALRGAGLHERSDAAFRDALELARRQGGRPLAETVLRCATARREPGLLDAETNALLEEGIAALPAEPGPLRARLLAQLAAGLNLQPGAERRRKLLADEATRIARGLGDPATLGFVLARRLVGLLGPDHLEERLATTDELLRTGRRSPAAELEALVFRVDDLAERADRVGLDHALGVFEQRAQSARLPLFRWHAASFRTAMALLEGRFADAENAVQETSALGRRAQARSAMLSVAQQLFVLRGWQDRVAEIETLFEQGVAATAVVPAWRCGLADLYQLLGREAEARRELEALAADDFADLPRDTTWLTAVALLAGLCARLRDRRRAELLYELMRPYAGRIAVARPLVVLVAPIDASLGALATLLGRYDAAETHFGDALAQASRMRALPWQADIRHEWARMLRERSARGDRERAQALLDEAEAIARPIGMQLLLRWIGESRAAWRVGAARAVGEESRAVGGEPRRGNVVSLLPRAAQSHAAVPQAPPAQPAQRAGTFRREGEVWTLGFEGRTTRVRHMLGLGHLARLLREPGREVHAAELVAAAYEGRRADAAAPAVTGDAGELLDARARASYEARLREAREELEEAQRHNDRGHSERLAEEIRFLAAELARGVGLGGRARRAGSTSERARLSVTRAIKYAIDKLADHDPALADHLRRGVRTGTFCAYEPSARERVTWNF